MNIVHDNLLKDKGSKPECELVENEKQEYKLIGKYRRTKGLRMYAYDCVNDNLYEADIKHNDSINLIVCDDKLVAEDLGVEECTVNSQHEHFEALNYKTAQRRLDKYKRGLIKELCNLKKYNPDGIKFW